MEQAPSFTSRPQIWISDAQVQAEIAYLDSSSDYREYLPEHDAKQAKELPLWILIVLSMFLFAVLWLFES